MGNRITKVVTRTGDRGETGLGNGARVPKNDLRICAIGDVDELNCTVGLILAEMDALNDLKTIQHRLFDLGGELSMPGSVYIIDQQDVDWLEKITEEINEELPPLKDFILPGGHPIVAKIHLARAVARRAERTVVDLSQHSLEGVNPNIIKFLNRLSDFLFVLARYLSKGQEVLWMPKPKP